MLTAPTMPTPLQPSKDVILGGKATIKVFVRTRPLLQKELAEGATNILTFLPSVKQVIVEDSSNANFTYDGVCDENASQEQVFNMVVAPLLSHIKDGHNATVIAYGQTGSGKTYTMGTYPTPDQDMVGILQRVMKSLFEAENESEPKPLVEGSLGSKEGKTCNYFLKINFLEVYNESVYDLFSSSNLVETKPDGYGGVVPINCKDEIVHNTQEGLSLLQKGNCLRKVASTKMNSDSSRSHALISIYLCQKKDGFSLPGGCLRLVDLAGAEGVGRNHMEGKGFCEGVSINKGLLAIGKVLAALSSNNAASHVPYRESIVTRLLRDALGGNGHTTMITCVSPASTNLSVTVNTLRYAEQARNIRIRPSGFSTIKRKGVKRGFEDVSATPSAWKRFVQEGNRPVHNSTISTPGHKPPVVKPVQSLNNTIMTPMSRPPGSCKPWPRTSSHADLTSFSVFAPLKQPVFEEEGDSPTHSIIGEPQTSNTFQISPLVDRVNLQLERSIMQYEQRFNHRMKDMENRLARKVARLLMKGTESRRISQRLLNKDLENLSPSVPPLNKEKSANDSSPGSFETPFSLADSIAEALYKKPYFQNVLHGTIKAENLIESKYAVNNENKSNKKIKYQNREPFQDISNLECSASAGKFYSETVTADEFYSTSNLPITSTAVFANRVVRKSTRLSTRESRQKLFEKTEKVNAISPLHVTLFDKTLERSDNFSTKTVIYQSDSSDLEDQKTVLYNKNKASPDLKNSVLPSAASQFHQLGSMNNKVPVVSLCKDESFCIETNLGQRRKSSRRSALLATQKNFEIFSNQSQLMKMRRLSTKKTMLANTLLINQSMRKAGLESSVLADEKEKWQLVISPTLQRKHNNSILHTLNTGNLRELQKLPTVGPKTAMVLYNFRGMCGKFKKVEDLKLVPGLPKSYYSRFMKANLMHQIDFK